MKSEVSKMTIGERIREIRKSKGMTQKQVAEQLGITIGAYSHYENGTRELDVLKVKALSKIFGISGDELIDTGFQNPVPDGVIDIKDLKWKKVPVLGSMAAGDPIEDPEFPGEYCDAPKEADFALKVKGDSMIPTYLDGDVVFIRKCPDLPHNGSICAVAVDNEAALKHVFRYSDHVMLTSDNQLYEPMMYSFAEHSIRILGVPVGFLRMYK